MHTTPSDSGDQPDVPVQRRVLFSGRVQGVGFRYSTRRIAGSFAVVGFVQNLPDGRVEVVAEGSALELDAFVAAIQQQMAGHISDTSSTCSTATGQFTTFSIRR